MKPSKPSRDDEDAIVDLLDVIMRDGAIVEADVIITVADIPLVGLKLRAALAGMTTMIEHGMFEDWDAAHRRRAQLEERRASSRSYSPAFEKRE
jgi:hypothetical protein